MNEIIEKTMKNLEKNNISAFYAESRKDVAAIIKNLCLRAVPFQTAEV